MYLTETDLINRKITAEGMLNTGEAIRALIEDDLFSPQKKRMAEGERYYIGEHDVLKRDFTSAYIAEVDELNNEERLEKFQNPNRSNHHTVNPFHKILVDQKTAYMVGREPTITVKGAEGDTSLKEYETLLSSFADEDFNETLCEWVTGASNKGMEALHIYFDDAGELQYCIIPASEIIPIYDTKYQRELEQLIRYYDITVTNGKKKYTRKRVEWWTKTEVTYYTETEKGIYVEDQLGSYNPAPHWFDIIKSNGMEAKREGHSWGRVPFILLQNNSKNTTDLQNIKGLIDAYDTISSEGTNNLLDLVDLYWYISGYGGETASAIARKLKINKAVNVGGGDGRIEAKQVDLPVTGRLEWMKMLRRDIYQFGMGIDVDADKFGNAPSGVSLKFQYGLLDMKANAMAAKIKRAIKELLWYFTTNYNRLHHTNYDSKLIEISLNYSAIANDAETVQMITASDGVVSHKTLLGHHPFVSDINAELEALQEEKEEQQKEMENYAGFPPNSHEGGGEVDEE